MPLGCTNVFHWLGALKDGTLSPSDWSSQSKAMFPSDRAMFPETPNFQLWSSPETGTLRAGSFPLRLEPAGRTVSPPQFVMSRTESHPAQP